MVGATWRRLYRVVVVELKPEKLYVPFGRRLWGPSALYSATVQHCDRPVRKEPTEQSKAEL